MTDIGRSLALLQYGDSFFPSGSVSFSWGIEALSEIGIVKSSEDVVSFLKGQLHARWSQFDRAVLTAAHGAKGDMSAVSEIDHQVEIQTTSLEVRTSSCRLGRALLSTFSRLGSEEAAAYLRLIGERGAYGHASPMQGWLWAKAGLSLEEAVALSAHTFCTSLLSAAVRLGCLTHLQAQTALEELRSEVCSIVETPVCGMDEISSCAFESELAIVGHARQNIRMFAN